MWQRPQKYVFMIANVSIFWINYSDIQKKNMQVIFILIVRARRYNSLRYTTLHYKVWSTNASANRSFYQRIWPIWRENDQDENKITREISLWIYQEKFVNFPLLCE